MENKLLIKILNKEFKPIRTGIDINNELMSINITKTSYEGSTITIKAPMTDNTKGWIKLIRETVYNNNPNETLYIADVNDNTSYFVINSVNLKLDKQTNNTIASISGVSVDKLLKTRLTTEKEYIETNISEVLRDIICSVGLGGVLDDTYPYALPNDDDNRYKRYIDSVLLEIEISNDDPISIATSLETADTVVSNILKTYGKRMYTVYDEIENKITIRIDDGNDKTAKTAGLKYLISSENENVKSIEYQMSREERVNVIVSSIGDVGQTYSNEDEINVPEGLNRIEYYSTNSGSDNNDIIEQEIEMEFSNADDSLEKINISAEFGADFNFGLGSGNVYIGDLVSISLYVDNGDRVIVDDIISEMNIVVDKTTTGSLIPTFIPTIGYDSTDDDGNYMTVRQRIYYKSNKNVQLLI